MNFQELGILVNTCSSLETAREYVDTLTGEDVIFAHNRLKELDDLLRDRWFEVGSPHPELLK